MSVVKGLGASGILIIDGRTLVIRRAMHDSGPGLWEFPKGNVETGESPSQTIVREYAEETGLKIKIEQSLGINNWSYQKNGNDHHVAESVFEVVLADGETADSVLLSNDHDAFKWVNARELEELEPMIEQRRQYLLASLANNK